MRFIKGRPNECFSNVLRVCANVPTLIYCEGIAGVGSCHHAWAQTAEGEIVECTWPRSYHNDRYPYRLSKAFTRPEVQAALVWNQMRRQILAPLLYRGQAWEMAGLEIEYYTPTGTRVINRRPVQEVAS
jgi:hypothetical protein